MLRNYKNKGVWGQRLAGNRGSKLLTLKSGHVEECIDLFFPCAMFPEVRTQEFLVVNRSGRPRKVSLHWALMMFVLGEMTPCLMCVFSS